MIQKPLTPKGTRDFSSDMVLRRKFVFQKVQSAFQRFGYVPIETPAMENLDTLLGKYGEEGDRLIFKIINSGDYLSKANFDEYITSKSLTPQISDKALRYDLTVPFARYVVNNRNDITFPFKRYQMQPVWRAERPQKGRYREFYQCDADVIGSKSLLCELELIQLYDEVFTNLGLQDFTININNRKILSGIAQVIGEPEKLIDITVALDKLDKIGKEKVEEELRLKGVTTSAISKMNPLFYLKGNNFEKLEILSTFLTDSEVGLRGVEELRYILDLVTNIGLRKSNIDIDVTLARGLNYYTGVIFEVKSNEVTIGSIGGGGRYDDLTSIFGLSDTSGVGISFGIDRICIVMEELNLFSDLEQANSKLMFINFGEAEAKYCLKLLKELREEGVSAEIYPSPSKMKKQMNYANKKNIEFVALVGENELKSGLITLKNMKNGSQENISKRELLSQLINSNE